MVSDAVPSPAITLGMSIGMLVGLEPGKLQGYVVVFLDGDSLVGVLSGGLEQLDAIGLMAAGIQRVVTQDEPDFRTGPDT